MSLALGRAILDDGRVDALSCAQAFDGWMRAKPIDIGNTVRRNLITFRRTGDPVAPPSEHDAGNGAAMRVLPVALATLALDEEAVRAATRAQAHVTHNNEHSDAAAEVLALVVQDAVRGEELRAIYRRRIRPFIERHRVFAFRPRRRENPSGWVVETMQAVLQGLLDTSSFENCVVDVINRGGDADTTGAIAGMLAGALYGRESLPPRWVKVLDPGIREACVTQARRLVAL
jgi:ADP-ribosyl-[dinitrogen reductase] hydrolase